jgi:hypothetical protein
MRPQCRIEFVEPDLFKPHIHRSRRVQCNDLNAAKTPDGRQPTLQSMSTLLPAPQHAVVVEDISDTDGGLHIRAHTSLPRIWTLRDERKSREAAGVRKSAPSPRA